MTISARATMPGRRVHSGVDWLLISMGDPTGGSFPTFYFPTRAYFDGVVLIVLMALVAGILPALQAQRLQIADALRR